MENTTLPIYNTEGKEVDTAKLDTAVFNGSVNTAAIYQAVNHYLANQRQGLAATKTRGEVAGGGRKPWRQKGTGRARVGSTRSPLWRHGGVIFGPHPRDFSYNLAPGIKKLALKSALNDKLKADKLVIIDEIKLEAPKTKAAAKIFSRLNVAPSKTEKKINVLLLLDKQDENLKRALRNLSFLKVNLAKDTQAYEVLAHKRVVITKGALQELTKRLK